MRVRYVLTVAAICILASGYFIARTGAGTQSVSTSGPKPLILEKEDGEHRVRRPREIPVPTGAFTIKVDQLNGGSKNLVLGTEVLAPHGTIPLHKHIGQDEIILIETGVAHVWLGDKEQEVHAGAAVFIPAETWISIKNSGSENVSIAFVFSAPGFDTYLRCTSVREGEKTSPMTGEEWRACQHTGHISFDAVPHSTFSNGAGSRSRADVTLLGVVGASAAFFGESADSRKEIVKKQTTKITPPGSKLCKDLAAD